MSTNVWVKFTIKGRGGDHHEYDLMRRDSVEQKEDGPDVKENLAEIAEEIARRNCIGQEYGFSWSHEIVEALPDRLRPRKNVAPPMPLDPKNPGFMFVSYVNDGQEVYARYKDQWVECRVVAAHGHHARVQNDELDVYALLHVDDLRVPAPTVH